MSSLRDADGPSDGAQLTLMGDVQAAEVRVPGRGATTEPQTTEPAPQPVEDERRALFVRLPVREFEAVARASFELGVHKQDLVATLVRRHVDVSTPEGLRTLRQLMG